MFHTHHFALIHFDLSKELFYHDIITISINTWYYASRETYILPLKYQSVHVTLHTVLDRTGMIWMKFRWGYFLIELKFGVSGVDKPPHAM